MEEYSAFIVVCKDKEEFLRIEIPKPKIKKKIKRKTKEAKSTRLWEVYDDLFLNTYKRHPKRGKDINMYLCQLIDKLGNNDAIKVLVQYFEEDNKFYKRVYHDLKFAVRDAHSLRLKIEGVRND